MVKKWTIFFANLDPIKGSEQRGIRPVLVVSNDAVNDNLPIVTIVPFSSVKQGAKIYPTEVYLSMQESGLTKDSVLMLHQIRTISKERLIGKPASQIVDKEIKQKINKAFMEYFEL